MPDDMAPPSSSPTEGISLDQNTPDLVGEELGDHARIWREYDRVAREDDKERISNWNRGLDNLALFAGLFSAVTTAFIIQLQNDLQPDYAELTFRVLNATASGLPFVEKPFALQPGVRAINCIWVSSLILSLTAALIAIMGKDWIGMYAARPVCNPRQWAEIRTYRLTCVERWYMPGVIASAPVLLHVSLILFATGLVLFVGSDMLSQLVAFALSIAAAGLYLFTMLSGIVFSTSPFKSPATQAARGGLSSLLLRIRDLLSHQRARAALSPRHERLQRGYVAALYDGTGTQASRQWWRRILCRISGLIRQSRPDRLAPELWEIPDPIARGLPIAPLEAPHRGFPIRQYVQVLRIYISDMLLRNYWDDVHLSPRPALLAQSVSFLYERSASPDTLWLILVALGDFVIGKDVAPSASPVILSRLTAELKRNWQRADLFTLSRYILLDMNLPQQALIGLSCGAELEKVRVHFENVASKCATPSEHALLAINILRTHWGGRLLPGDVDAHCPTVATQPNLLRYLLVPGKMSTLPLGDSIIILANRYWPHLEHDPSFDLHSALLASLGPDDRHSYHSQFLAGCQQMNVHLPADCEQSSSEARASLLELLVFLLTRRAPWAVKDACELIMKALNAEWPPREHPGLVYAFGSDDSRIIAAAWPTRPWPLHHLRRLVEALPLIRYRLFRWDERSAPPSSDEHRAFEIVFSRMVIRLLSPQQPLVSEGMYYGDGGSNKSLSILELCIRVLHTQLCHSRSLLDSETKSELISLVLEQRALIRICNDRYHRAYGCSNFNDLPDRGILNILTIIARHLARLLGRSDTFDQGARLMCLFVSSEAQNADGITVTWDLGQYLHEMLGHDPKFGGAGAALSRRRLLSAVQALRPFCITCVDLLAAWDTMNLPSHGQMPFWDADFALGEFFPLVGTETATAAYLPNSRSESQLLQRLDPAVHPIEYITQFSLEASMR